MRDDDGTDTAVGMVTIVRRSCGAKLLASGDRFLAVEVRGRGYMQAVELQGVDAMDLVGRALREQRLVLNATSPTTLRLLPPLVISGADLGEALGRLDALLG